jgi:molybdopterin/thiamine biosynthesis adenylyltransferase
MPEEIEFSRQTVIWGKEGQDLLDGSSLLVLGADKLGREVIKSASILGIRTVYVIDNLKVCGKELFLDIPLKIGESVATEMERLIPCVLNEKCRVKAFHSYPSAALMASLDGIDFIIDTTNNLESQCLAVEMSKKKGISAILAGTNEIGGAFSYYNAAGPYGGGMVAGFEHMRQGNIMANIFAGMIVEEFRKAVFKANRDAFNGVMILQRDGTKRAYLETLDSEEPMAEDVVYSIIGDDRFRDPRTIDEYVADDELRGSSILVLGGGSSANYVVDMLARMHLKRIDVLDFDIYERHNLNRQPLAYDGVLQKKCAVLAKKIKTISEESVESRGFFGKVAERLTDDEKQDRLKLFNFDWFRKQEYDMVFGCFDNHDVRALVNSYMTSLRIPYLDTGSSPGSATVHVYVPGKTRCLECSDQINFAAQQSRATRQRMEEHEIRNLGCRFVDGSVNMSNQTGAGIMVAEARKVADPSLGRMTECVRYRGSSAYEKLQAADESYTCNCGQDDTR